MANNDFSKRLKSLLDETKTTRQQLATEIGVSHQSVTQWQSGQTIPDILKFKRIAEFFDVSYDYLLGDSDSRKHENALLVNTLGLSDSAVDEIKRWKRSSEKKNDSFSVSVFESLSGFFDYPGFEDVLERTSDFYRQYAVFRDDEGEKSNTGYCKYLAVSAFEGLLQYEAEMWYAEYQLAAREKNLC
jgi:transcriptional regulator with XRE-family HTH domain